MISNSPPIAFTMVCSVLRYISTRLSMRETAGCLEARSEKLEVRRSRKPKVRSQKSEVGSRKPEARRRGASGNREQGIGNWELGIGNRELAQNRQRNISLLCPFGKIPGAFCYAGSTGGRGNATTRALAVPAG